MTDPDITRLTWFAALITDYEDHLPGVDPEAEQTCLSECRKLLASLEDGSYAAAAMARRKSPRKALAHRANAARMNAAKKLAPCTCGVESADGSRHRSTCPVWKRAYARMRRGL